MITGTYPATFHEVGYARAERDQHPWYLVEREEVIGLTGELQDGDDIISIFEVWTGAMS